MRLVKCSPNGALSLTDDLADQDLPQYVIVSHTWGPPGQEVTFQDFQSRYIRRRKGKSAYKKIQFCSNQAYRDGYQYIWIDTCCIDKTNSVELSEAINSMFRWYREAARCYVYLSDVQAVSSQSSDWLDDFKNSRWFTRGWTLQELLAPASVEFFSFHGIRLGDKTSLAGDIHKVTGIPIEALQGRSLSDFSVSERMGWAARRTTTRKEDEAYSLLGIFSVYMPLIYGEREQALVRLRELIDRSIQGTKDCTRPPKSGPYSSTNDAHSVAIAPHPVKKNYRKVHVIILYWEVDGLDDVVQRISTVFRDLYHYEVQEIPLPHRHKVGPSWPWTDESVVDERDLQIMYYLGSTTHGGSRFPSVMAVPAKSLSDEAAYPSELKPLQEDNRQASLLEKFPGRAWLEALIGIPQLTSDVLIVVDSFVEDIVRPEAPETIQILMEDDNSWARYLVLFAGYPTASTIPGALSLRLTSILEELATLNRFYAREGLITSGMVLDKLRKVRTNDDLDLRSFGNEGRNSIHMSPL